MKIIGIYLLMLALICLMHSVVVGLFVLTKHSRYSFKESWQFIKKPIIAVSIGYWGVHLIRFISTLNWYVDL